MEKESLDVRPGREAGLACGATDPDVPTYTCMLLPGHLGNIHVSGAHVWLFAGREVPVAVPVDTEVQCPNCNLVYSTKMARSVDTAKEALPGQVVRTAVSVVGGGPVVG
jgi:hypothetical protein